MQLVTAKTDNQHPKHPEEDTSSEIRVGLGKAELTSDGRLAVTASLPTCGGGTRSGAGESQEHSVQGRSGMRNVVN